MCERMSMTYYVFFAVGCLIPFVISGKPSIVRKQHINGTTPDGRPLYISYINFAKFPDKMLVVGKPLATVDATHFNQCNEKCLEMDDCVSMNVYKENGTKCDLLSTDHNGGDEALLLDVKGVDYYEPKVGIGIFYLSLA